MPKQAIYIHARCKLEILKALYHLSFPFVFSFFRENIELELLNFVH